MADDDMAQRLEEAAKAPRARSQDPKAIVRDLAENSPSESTKLSAARALMEMQAEERARRDDSKSANPLGDVGDFELYKIADENLAADLRALLRPDASALLPREKYPLSHEVLETTIAALIEEGVSRRVTAALAASEDAAEFERRVAEAAAERAEELAEERVAALRSELTMELPAADPQALSSAAPKSRRDGRGPVWVDQREPSGLLSPP